jgi:hypothetical protein
MTYFSVIITEITGQINDFFYWEYAIRILQSNEVNRLSELLAIKIYYSKTWTFVLG